MKMMFLISSLAMIFFSNAAVALDTFDPASKNLTIPSVQVGGTVYTNVVLRLDSFAVISVGGSQAPTVSEVCSKSNFSNQIFNAINLGMTLSQVNSTIGCMYTPSRTGRSSTFTSYTWTVVEQALAIVVYFDANGNLVTNQGGGFFKVAAGF